MAKFNLEREIEKVNERLDSQDQTLGKGAMQPNRATNSGSRAIMQCTQIEQILTLMNPEPPHYATGLENRFGQMSSNYVETDANYIVIDKIPKYSFDNSPTRKYTMIVLDPDKNVIHSIERTPFQYVSESYGYRMNTDTMDGYVTGDLIPRGTLIKKTESFDEYDNRQDGLNLTTMYSAYAATTEDPTVIRQGIAEKFASPLFDKIPIMINNNDILLNLYGGDGIDEYKAFPNIGEEVKDGILCAIRREKKEEEALFSQSWKQLQEFMISDEKYPVNGGTVVDIDVYCNDPDELKQSVYNQQILIYYKETTAYAQKIVDCVRPMVERGITLTYDMSKLYAKCLDIINGIQYISDKVYNGIYMIITVMRVEPLHVGDKLSDRYGGKGVVSRIIPDEDMPQVQGLNGVWEPVDILYNKCTCVNRLNPGQLFEISVNAYGEALIEYLVHHNIDTHRCFELIHQFISIISPNQAKMFMEDYYNMPDDDKYTFIRSHILDGCIYIITKPLTESINIDTLRTLRNTFPFLNIQKPVLINMKDSNGNIRKIMSHNKNITIGKKYIYRLKQIADDKFSTVSLAATNIRGENTKSKASKLHKSPFPSTPVRFGEMEFGDLLHMLDAILVDSQLMRMSSSPIGRAQHEDLLTGNPFVADIKLNSDAKSRPVEIVNAYLKTIGLRLSINKKKKDNITVTRTVYKKLPKFPVVDVYQKRPFDITQEQAEAIVYAFNQSIDKPVDVVWKTDVESTMRRVQKNMYEAAKLANRAKNDLNVTNADDLLKAVNDGKLGPEKLYPYTIIPYRIIPKEEKEE